MRPAELLRRAARLEAQLARCRARALEEDEALAALRASVARLRERNAARAAAAARLEAALEPEPPRASPWRRAALALAVLTAAALAAHTLPARPKAGAPKPAEAPPASLDAGEAEALRLVYEYRAPGSDRSLLERLAAPETPGGPSPWRVEPLEGSLYEVTYAPEDCAFESDVARGTVVRLRGCASPSASGL